MRMIDRDGMVAAYLPFPGLAFFLHASTDIEGHGFTETVDIFHQSPGVCNPAYSPYLAGSRETTL